MRELARGVLFGIVAVLFIVGVATFARAEWNGPVSPEIEAWFRTVTNAEGAVCCDGTEVAPVDDYQWRGDHFDVLVDGVIYHAPASRVSPDRNRLGSALVWFYPRGAARSDETLRCFLRGIET